MGAEPSLTVGLLIHQVEDIRVRLADGSSMNFEFKGTRQSILVNSDH